MNLYKGSWKRTARRIGNRFLGSFGCHIVACPPALKASGEIGEASVGYIRKACLMLAADEIARKQLSGSVAELGVYRGDFAKEINLAFPDKELYLFDTFEGFDRRDVQTEVKSAYSDGTQDFSNTSVEYVLKRMKHPEKCRIVKGYFPESLEKLRGGGKSWNFCFVSIDADLFEPIYAGLCWFYPRLEMGGYIFVHDFLSGQYKGAAEAVRKFSEESGAPYVILPDSCGTAVLVK